MKKTIITKIITFSLIIILLTMTVNAIWCYQETANASTDCGGLDTGTYLCSGTWDGTQTCSLTYDESWDTYGDSGIGQTTFIHINYTKPNNTTNATWKTKIGNEGIETYDIFTDCWNRTIVEFKIESEHNAPYVAGSCYNGSAWKLLATDEASPYVYEEGINWNIPASNTCDYSSGDWIVNAADECYWPSSINLLGNNLLINGTGTITLTGTIYNAATIKVQGATLNIQGGTLRTG